MNKQQAARWGTEVDGYRNLPKISGGQNLRAYGSLTTNANSRNCGLA